MKISVAKAQAILDDRADKAFRLLVFAAHKSIVEKTPVKTGRARGNWMVSVGSPQWSEQESDKSPGGRITIMREFAKRNEVDIEETAYIINGVEYVPHLERGTDKFPPFGMIAVTEQELKAKIAEVAALVRQAS